jgi:hypothetical protein
MLHVSRWMSWQDGVHLSAVTSADLITPNLIIHLGRMVNTPIGNAPAGIILWQPNPPIMPAVMGFVCSDKNVGRYFGPQIFADTPFEHAPVLNASISVLIDSHKAISTCVVGGYHFEVEMSEFTAPYLINRQPDIMPPYWQQGVEISCSKTILRINGETINIIVPPVGVKGGPGSTVCPAGIFSR